MKSFQTITATLILAMFLVACSNSDANKDSAESTNAPVETTTTQNAVDGKQEKLDANKKLVTDFIQAFYGDKDSAAIDKYIADNLKTHNPLLQDGKATLKSSLRPFLENPNIEKVKIDIRQTCAEGDKVWVLIREVAPNGKVFARVDIFRIENGKIAENWLVSQAEAKESANQNTMF